MPLTHEDIREILRLIDESDLAELRIETHGFSLHVRKDGAGAPALAPRHDDDPAAASDELIAATDIADLLVRLGMPFREAHGVVAGLVRATLDSGRTLSQVGAEELATHSDTLGAHYEEYQRVLSQESWLESKISEGATSSARLREQLVLARAALASHGGGDPSPEGNAEPPA